MSVMAATQILTREHLDALPDDGLRHELIDGAFILTPAPGVPHQAVVAALYRKLWAACESSDLAVFFAPLDVVLGESVVEPDLVIAPRDAFTAYELPTPPVLVVEVRSSSTAWLDQGRKRTLYEEHGIASYWLVDPATPSITILELEGGHYVQKAFAHGDETVSVIAPFAVDVNPAELTKG